MLIFRL